MIGYRYLQLTKEDWFGPWLLYMDMYRVVVFRNKIIQSYFIFSLLNWNLPTSSVFQFLFFKEYSDSHKNLQILSKKKVCYWRAPYWNKIFSHVLLMLLSLILLEILNPFMPWSKTLKTLILLLSCLLAYFLSFLAIYFIVYNSYYFILLSLLLILEMPGSIWHY